MSNMTKEDTKYNKEAQVERLISQEYVNPYDILEVGFEASEVEIKKKF